MAWFTSQYGDNDRPNADNNVLPWRNGPRLESAHGDSRTSRRCRVRASARPQGGAAAISAVERKAGPSTGHYASAAPGPARGARPSRTQRPYDQRRREVSARQAQHRCRARRPDGGSRVGGTGQRRIRPTSRPAAVDRGGPPIRRITRPSGTPILRRALRRSSRQALRAGRGVVLPRRGHARRERVDRPRC